MFFFSFLKKQAYKKKRKGNQRRGQLSSCPQRGLAVIPLPQTGSRTYCCPNGKVPGVPWRKPEPAGYWIAEEAWASLSISAGTIEPAALSTIHQRLGPPYMANRVSAALNSQGIMQWWQEKGEIYKNNTITFTFSFSWRHWKVVILKCGTSSGPSHEMQLNKRMCKLGESTAQSVLHRLQIRQGMAAIQIQT